MVELALKAQLPLIATRTDDTLNVVEVLAHYADDDVLDVDVVEGGIQAEGTYFMAYNITGAVEEMYAYLVQEGKVLILVNTDIESPLVFDAGELPTPKELIRKHLDQTGLAPEQLDGIMPTLGGMTLKEVAEIARLAMTHGGALTPQSVMTVRRLFLSRLKGIQQVDTEMPFYQPPKPLTRWNSLNSEFFLGEYDHRLVPRGLLFDGPPGTGKSQGAKHVANCLGVPLYMLDLGGLMGKYVGESEGNLKTALQQVDNESPCVLLMDEVEKVFKTQDDSGVTTRLLSRLLWWLQEHRSRVLTIMTTNDKDALPVELYREGRIDETITFPGMPVTQSGDFIERLLKTIPEAAVWQSSQMSILRDRVVQGLWKEDQLTENRSHAQVTQAVLIEVKKVLTKP